MGKLLVIKLLGERAARQFTGLVAGRGLHYTEPPRDKISLSQSDSDRKVERREHISCANVAIHGSGMEFLL
jgi:hypothetical protein